MDWLFNILTIAAPASILVAVLGHFLAIRRDERSSNQQARYLALRVAIILENYAGECLNHLSQIQMGFDLNADPSSLSTNIPLVPDYPEDDLGWRSLEPELAHKAMTIPVERAAKQGRVNEDWMECGPTSAPFECARQCAIIGLSAWDCALALRERYKLPPFDPSYRFDESLRQRVERDRVNREKFQQNQAKSLDQMNTSIDTVGKTVDTEN